MIILSIVSFSLAVVCYAVKELQAHGKLRWMKETYGGSLPLFWESDSWMRKYKKEIQSKDFSKALDLDKDQIKRLNNAIQKAYNQEWHPEGPNIDQINAIVAPYIKTQEEAFYAAVTIMSDVFGALMAAKMPMPKI